MIGILAAAMQAAPQAIPPSTPVTIQQVRADPRRWHGQWVQLDGWINSCSPVDCALAERPSPSPADRGFSLAFEAQPEFDRWVAPMLPLRAQVYARIDATCLVNLCTDRGQVLRQMIVKPVQANVRFPNEER